MKEAKVQTKGAGAFFEGATCSGLRTDEVSSALQKAIRRCEQKEAIIRGIDLVNSGKMRRTHVLKRLLIIASEDVGPANPSLILFVDDLLDVDNLNAEFNMENFLNAIDMLAISPKSRLFDWTCCSLKHPNYFFSGKDNFGILKHALIRLECSLNDRAFEEACRDLFTVHVFDMSNKFELSFTKDQWEACHKMFDSPPGFRTAYKKIIAFMWLPIMSCAKATKNQEAYNLVCRLYYIAHGRKGSISFREKSEGVLFAVHAVWAVCNTQKVKETWYLDFNLRLGKTHMLEEEDKEALKKGDLKIPIPDHALDKHTAAGKKKGRSYEHFILEGSKIVPHFKEVRDEELKWLSSSIAKFKREDKLDASFRLPDGYLA
jgi:hypothetical protein